MMGFWIAVGVLFGVMYLALFFYRWIVIPIRMRARYSMAAHPTWEPVLPEHLTPEMRDFLALAVAKFREEGFELAASVHNPDSVKNVNSVQVLLVNRSTNDMAELMLVQAALTRAIVYGVGSELADGRRIGTSAKSGIGFMPPDPSEDVANFPWAAGPRALCEAHRRRLQRARRTNAPRVAPAPGAEYQFLEAEWHREMQRQVDCGYVYHDQRSDQYRLTWKGGFLTAWKLMQPIKGWRTRLRDRRFRKLWNDLGMSSWAPPVDAAAPVAVLPNVQSNETERSPQIAASLGYEPTLRDGELRQEKTESGVVIRMGAATLGQYLTRHWFTLLMLCLMCAMVALNLHQFYKARQFYRSLPPLWRQMIPEPKLSIYFYIGAALGVFYALQITIGLLRLRGSSVVTATERGLTYANAPAGTARGEILRQEIDSVLVMPSRLSLRGVVWQIEVRGHAGNKQVLMTGKDRAGLESARGAMLQAMGMVQEQQPAATQPS